MQPIYVTQSSSGSSPWKLLNWHVTPVNVGLAVLSTGGSSWAVEFTMEDPTMVYPNPNSSTPTVFTYAISTGAANTSLAGLSAPVAAVRLTINSGSGATTLVMLQAGIG
jgi:hypothetical protein